MLKHQIGTYWYILAHIGTKAFALASRIKAKHQQSNGLHLQSNGFYSFILLFYYSFILL